ncbi:MAG: type IV pilus twitching motility protein PilT [Candidatus Dojkabacteria bacterium]|jgi:twitching motility protein PilT
MNQNTAQDNTQNVQFAYPDFSQNQGAGITQTTPNPQQTQTVNEESQVKIDELKQDLQKMIEEEEISPEPGGVQAPEVVTPAQQPELKEEVVQKEGEAYVQEPTPLPKLEERDTEGPIIIQPPNVTDFDPLPSDLPKFRETLDSVMPSPKEPVVEKETVENEIVEDEQQPVEERESLKDVTPQIQQENTQQNVEFDSPSELTMEKLLGEATGRNASDLHISVGYPPIIRIDGELVALEESILNPEDVEELVFSVLTDERKELLEVNREIDFAYTYEGSHNARFRVNAYYTTKTLAAAFRVIPTRVRTIEELMLPQMYHQFTKLKQGLILVTGPTGHGKSTTLAAMLEDINRTRFCHIITIEDPIEYIFEGKKALIDQREMNDDTHSWKIALRSAMRQDPDVILVGEMRDYETIASAITLAETGHLVFATLHTNSAAQTLDRIVDVFPENQQQQVRTQIANTLQAVIAQRLIPLEKGGRRAVSEIMLNNAAVKNLIREGKMHQVDNVIRTSADVGMVYLERSLVDLVREGVISVQTAQEYSVHPEEVLRLLKT